MITAIRLKRIKTGETLRDFARRNGFNENMLIHIERAQYYVPPAWRPRLAKALNMTIDEICDERGWPRLVE